MPGGSRTCWGRRVGLPDEERAALFYVAVLSWVGCVADTPEAARWFGDESLSGATASTSTLAGLPALTFLLGHAAAGRPALHKLGRTSALVVTGGRGIEGGLLSHCLSTAVLADRLGLGAPVALRRPAVLHPLGRRRGPRPVSAGDRGSR